MHLYHYTSIKSLAAILSSHNFRFTRLDLVDDPEEYCYKKDDIDYAKYAYVSCFTNNPYENQPQWEMYADKKHGVRLEFESELFDIFGDAGHRYLAYPISYYADKEYMVMPILPIGLLREIQYVDNVKEYITNEIYKTLTQGKALDFKNIGIYKSKDWAFLKEWRYIINVLPNPKRLQCRSIGEVVQKHFYPSEEYLDIPIKAGAFQKMKIMIGPKVDNTEAVIVSSLMWKYLGREDYEVSKFRGL